MPLSASETVPVIRPVAVNTGHTIRFPADDGGVIEQDMRIVSIDRSDLLPSGSGWVFFRHDGRVICLRRPAM